MKKQSRPWQGAAALDDKSASPFHAESSDLGNIDVLSRTIAALEKGVSGSNFLQSHVSPAILGVLTTCPHVMCSAGSW